MQRIALTGNIASGKSAVAHVWERLGAHIIDADVLAREAVAPGTDALRRIAEHFGAGVLQPDGSLDRAALRARVFGSPAERRALEQIVHPEVQRLRAHAEAALEEQGIARVAYVIPLLFEAGMQNDFDLVVLVDAPEHVRLRRIVERRGVGESEAAAMIAAQMPAAEKRAAADHVIENDADLNRLQERAAEVWRRISGSHT